MSNGNNCPPYQIEPKNLFVEANRRIVEYEIRPGNTVSFFGEVDLTQVERIRKAAGKNRPSYTAFVAKAVALALREYPYANRRFCRPAGWPLRGLRLQRFTTCDVAVACEREMPGAEGVAFVDILRDADQGSLEAMTRWLSDLATCDVDTNQQWGSFSKIVRSLPNWLSALLIRLPYFSPPLWAKYRGGAVLISSPAKYGVDAVAGTWSWPLGVSFGLVKKRPVVRGEEIVPCPTFTLTLNFDRRVMAGAPAARFFKRIVDVLQQAEKEMAPYLPSGALAQSNGQVAACQAAVPEG